MGTVRVEDRSAGVRWLTLDRPTANAENETLLADLLAAVEQASSDPTMRVVLTGGSSSGASTYRDLGATTKKSW